MPGSRRWWLVVVGYVVVLFGVQPWLGFAVDAAKARWGTQAFAAAVTAAAIGAGVVLVLVAIPMLRRASRIELAALALAAALYALGIAALEIPQERLHYVEYGLLAAMLFAGMAPGDDAQGPWRAALLAVVSTAAIGWLDEVVQGAFWERRYFDWRDVELNARAAVLGVLAGVPLHRAWRRGGRD